MAARTKPVTEDEVTALIDAMQDHTSTAHELSHRMELTARETAIASPATRAAELMTAGLALIDLARKIIYSSRMAEMKRETEDLIRGRMGTQ